MYSEEEIKFQQTVIESAEKVYKSLGPGHNERIYHKALIYELNCLGIIIDTEMNIVVKYEDSLGNMHHLETERIDIFVHNHNIILELKAIQRDIHAQEKCQLQKYFNELNKINRSVNYGIIINFRQPNSKEIPGDIEYCIVKNDSS